MSTTESGLASPRLRALIAAPPRETGPAQDRCELCGEPITAGHRHLLDVNARDLLCACRACSILFDHRAAGGDHYRLVSDRYERLDGFRMDDTAWRSLRLPVDAAFFVRDGASGRVTAFYPSPAGATESLLELDTWRELENTNPVLASMQPDVEALLVNRLGTAREHWLVGVDACYRLVAIVRTSWSGFTGGDEVWSRIEAFFDELRTRARTAAR